MGRYVLWIVVVVMVALLQTTWLGAIRIGGVVPDLTLLLVVYFAIAHGEERAMFTGVVGGLFQDVASHAVLGHHIVCHVIAGYAVGRLSARLITEHPAVKGGLVLCAGLVNGLLFTIIQYVQHPDLDAMHTVTALVIPGAFYTALATPVVFFFLARLFPQDETMQSDIV